MSESRDPVRQSTVGPAEETRDVISAWTEASNRYLQSLQGFAAQLPGAPGEFQAPNPKEIVDAYYEVARQALDMQHQVLSQAYERFGGLFSTTQQPAPEKATEQVNEAARAGQQAASTGERGSQSGARRGG